ncbi:hypothetical protein DCC84_22430 [Pseudomonas sp. SXM-1]|nr:hypothetical protein DCC84_22430 [Pseudomonas sp. SXM-1]
MITWTFDCSQALRRNAYRDAPHQLVQNFNLALTAGRRASGAAFPRGAWEQSITLLPHHSAPRLG